MQKWNAILVGGTLTSFSDTSMLIGKQKVASIAGWYEAEYQLKAWAIFFMVFLGYDRVRPTTYETFLLLEETSGVSLRRRAQARQQPTFSAATLRLIQ